jgi:hypothetical protein
VAKEIAIKRHDEEKTSKGDGRVEEEDLFSVGIARKQEGPKCKSEGRTDVKDTPSVI